MGKFTEEHLHRQDFVDNEIYNLLRRLVPMSKEIEWDIEMIGDIRDTIVGWLEDKSIITDEFEFYP